MLMADQIIEISSTKVKTSLLITENNIFIDVDHLSESGIIEHMAQTCSAIFGHTFYKEENNESKRLIGFITNIKKLTISSLPKYNSTIISKAEKISEYENICNINCQTFCNNILIADAEMSMFIREI